MSLPRGVVGGAGGTVEVGGLLVGCGGALCVCVLFDLNVFICPTSHSRLSRGEEGGFGGVAGCVGG